MGKWEYCLNVKVEMLKWTAKDTQGGMDAYIDLHSFEGRWYVLRIQNGQYGHLGSASYGCL